MRIPKFALAAQAAALLAAATLAAQQAPAVPPPLDPANLDTTCSPCKNFYRFANGGWITRNPIPPAYSAWSSFNELTERNDELLRTVLETAARRAETTTDPNTRKVGRFYATCMDSTAAEAAGAAPIRDELARIGAVTTRDQLKREIARRHAEGLGGVFGFGATRDLKDADRTIAGADQGGLGLPDRDNYFRDDSASRKMRADYQAHATAILRLLGEGEADAARHAAAILALETALAEGSMGRVERRDPNARYHLMTVAQADTVAPGWSWSAFLRDVGLPRVTEINLGNPAYFKRLAKELDERPLDDWKAYLRFRTAWGASGWLSTPFVQQNFRYSSQLSGQRQMQPRWRRCLRLADNVLGDVLGQEYARQAFTPEAKARMVSMVANLQGVLADRIRANSWMSAETKTRALAKLSTFEEKIGYPDRWRDYSDLEVGTGHFVSNLRAAQRFSNRRDLAKIGQPVDRTEWAMTVPTVNAYYSPVNNEIGFPAGRLQPPFFHVTYDDAANYGGIGGTIGHEITHGFDDQGRKFDAEGNLADWWTADDATRFGERAGMVERQYDAFTVLDTVHVNGKLTLGENIADIGGVTVAYYALQRALEGKPRPLIDGFTPEQRFFLAYAQARRGVMRPEQLRIMIQTDPHSPGEFRVNGPLSNMPEFAKAFGCKPGDPMVRPEGERVEIW